MRFFTYLVGLLSIVLPIAKATPIAEAPAASSTKLAVFEKLASIPREWHRGDAVPASHKLRFRIALKLQNAFEFEQHVIDISTPGHPKYGQHMSHQDLKRALRPSSEATAAITGWLEGEGLTSENIEDDGDWINIYITTAEAEKLMDTKFYYYTNSVNKERRVRTLQYSVPANIQQYVQMIQPTIRFGQLQPKRSTSLKMGSGVDLAEAKPYFKKHQSGLNATFCNTTITPACLRELYKIGDYKADPHNGNKLGICGYLKQYAKYSDLAQFLQLFAPEQDPKLNNFTYVLINGGKDYQNSTDNDVEANLDVQYAMSLSYLTPTTYYSTGGLGELVPDLDQPDLSKNQNEPYLDFLHYIIKLPDSELPKTLTTSYGEDEQSVPASYANATCNLFAQLGARGVSVLFSSGDTGVGSACQTNDGGDTTRFLPIFPAACPFVTSVGGTYHVQPERAIRFSSGGFSDHFPRPAYQDAAVKEYLKILGPRWKGLYNPAGRGFPDVAAQAYNFSVVDAKTVIPVAGTSASSPAFAGVIALLNSARLSAGKRPLGFLNPWIYSVGRHGLTDIVDGGSGGCTGRDIYSGLSTPIVPYASWNATPGWDPVTGYGTPNFKKLLPLAMGY